MKSKGHQIILCMDLNEDSNRNNGPLYQTLTCKNNLISIMKSTHKIDTPPTYKAGSCTIDAILVSPSLTNVTTSSWLPFGEGIGDHRIAFIDINSKIVLNRDRHDIIPIKARLLQVDKEKKC